MKTISAFILISLSLLLLVGCQIETDRGILIDDIFELSYGSSIYDFTVKSIDGVVVPLYIFEGSVLLIVNVASECGLTYQYDGLQQLYEKYGLYDFEILAFPSNNFDNQEPGTNEQIKEFCQNVYGVTFPLFEKIDVLGENKSTLFEFLVNNAPYDDQGVDIEWNFAKFLVDRDGNIYKRYHPQVEPEELEEDIVSLLGFS